MPDVSKYKPWIKLSLELIILALVIVILARPRAGARTEVTKVRGIEAMLCVDVSNSMLASSTDDPKGASRMQRTKLVLDRVIDKLREDKIGLIVFAGNAYTQMPITTDGVSAKMFLNEISTNMVPSQGTAIGSAIKLAMNSFTKNEKTQKAIIIITDGENHEDDAVAMAKEAKEKGGAMNKRSEWQNKYDKTHCKLVYLKLLALLQLQNKMLRIMLMVSSKLLVTMKLLALPLL